MDRNGGDVFAGGAVVAADRRAGRLQHRFTAALRAALSVFSCQVFIAVSTHSVGFADNAARKRRNQPTTREAQRPMSFPTKLHLALAQQPSAG